MAYSAHDTDISYLLAALGINETHLIPYAAAVILELWGPTPPATEAQYVLRTVYKQGWNDSDGTLLQLPACQGRPATDGCPLDQVITQLKPLLLSPAEFDERCSLSHQAQLNQTEPNSNSDRTRYTHTLVMVSLALGFAILLCIFVVLLVARRMRRRKHFLHDDEQIVFVRFDQHT